MAYKEVLSFLWNLVIGGRSITCTLRICIKPHFAFLYLLFHLKAPNPLPSSIMVAADSDSAPSRRMPLSCEPCRERKIRCPRKSNRNGGPCDTCVRRGIPSSECVYLRDIIYQRRQQQNSSNSRSSVTDTPNNAELVARIDRLEEILVQAQQQQQTQTLPQMQQDQPSGASLFRGNDNNDCSPTGLPTPVSIHSSNGALRKSDTGYERYEPSFSRWLSVLNANSQPMGLKDDLDLWPNNSEFPFTTVQADVEELPVSSTPIVTV